MSAEQPRGLEGVGEREAEEPTLDGASEPQSAEQPAAPKIEPELVSTGVAESTPREPRVVWLTAASRAAALWSVVGAALIVFVQFTFSASWVTKLLRDNDLAPGARSRLLVSLVGGAAAGALAAFALTFFLWRRRRQAREVERIAWFAAPLGLSAFLPVLLRQQAWDQDLGLLAAIALFAVIVEGTLVRSLGVTPERVLQALRRLRDRLPSRLLEHAPLVIVALACLTFAIVIGRYSIIRHHTLESATFDLGLSDNFVYNAMLGKFRCPMFTGNRPDGPTFLSNHAQFGVFLLAPFYAIRPSSETLVVIQAALVALGALPLYFFACRYVSPWVSACIALVYLSNPALQGAAMYEMTYLPIAAVFVLGAAWAVDAGRWIPLALFAACGMAMREDIPIGMCLIGIVFLMSGKRFAMGAALAAVSAVYFVVVRFYLMEKAGGWQFPSMMYGELLPAGAKASFGSVIKTLITNPFFVLKKILIEQKLVYVMHLLVPLALLPLRRAWLLAALVPGALATLTTTNYGPTVSLGFQYVMHWIPYIFLAVPLALAAIRAEQGGGRVKMAAALVALVAATAVHAYHYGAIGSALGSDKFRVGFGTFTPNIGRVERERYADLFALIKDLPRDTSVAATSRVGPHISNRKEAYITDDLGLQDAEYLVYWKTELGSLNNRPLIIGALQQKTYGVVEIRGEFALLKKGYDTARNAELAKAWNLD